jgi:hypothetical protein
MAHVLYQNGQKMGEVENWSVKDRPSERKIVLGKVVSYDERPGQECSFISPKPVKRKDKLVIKVDQKIEIVIQQTKIVGGTEVTALIVSQTGV